MKTWLLNHFNIRQSVKWALFSALAGPISIVLHEAGHALMAITLGYSDVRITYHSVDRIAPPDISPWERALTSEAGPIASLIIVLACILIIKFRKHSIFAKALAMIAAIQFTGGLIYVVGSIFGADPSADFDAARFAQYLNISVFFPSLLEALVLAGTWIFVILLIKPSERVSAVIGIIVGGAFGIFVWLVMLGPVLLP